jgi:hypothetical protein
MAVSRKELMKRTRPITPDEAIALAEKYTLEGISMLTKAHGYLMAVKNPESTRVPKSWEGDPSLLPNK